jgi:VWFA-related protein
MRRNAEAVRWLSFAAAGLGLLPAALHGQPAGSGQSPAAPPVTAAQVQVPLQQAPNDPGIVTLRASSRLTVVDVTVNDGKGQPIEGLKASDFHIFEDGKEQPINHFEELRADVPRATRQPPALPPNVYTNLQPPPNSSSVNVILMDALNTKLTDQAFVKSETLAYLKTLAPGTRVAIMTLSNQLRILQGFTQDGAVLAAAVKSKNNRQLPSPLMNTDMDDTNDSLADVVDAGTAAALQEFANETNSFQTDMRNRMTLEALDQISGYLSTIPGRKNLIWFTAGMPLQMFPQGGVNDLATMTDYTKELRRTTDLLTAAQIAVYPVDAQGLHGNMQGSATSGGSGFANGNGGAKMAASNLAFLQKTGAEQLSMVAVAEATGGVAYFNTNGLKEAIAKAIANGANYYTITYVPPVPKYDGAFHKISVKVDRPGAKLAYRSGYYSDDVAHNEAGGTSLTPASAGGPMVVDDMAESMRRGVPTSSQILFDVRVQPDTGTMNPPGTKPAGVLNPKLQDKPLKRYDVQYIFPARQIMFTDAPNNMHHGALEFEVAAYDVNGTMLNSISQSIELPLAADAYNKLQKSPFQFFQQLDLPPGDIFLRIGIHDITASRIGTLEIPVAVTKKADPSTVKPPAP